MSLGTITNAACTASPTIMQMQVPGCAIRAGMRSPQNCVSSNQKSQHPCSSADLLQHWLTGICYSGVPVEGCMRICVDEPDSHEDGVDECAAACHGRFFPLHLASLDLDRITTRPSVVGT